jgi:hypothetical protein
MNMKEKNETRIKDRDQSLARPPGPFDKSRLVQQSQTDVLPPSKALPSLPAPGTMAIPAETQENALRTIEDAMNNAMWSPEKPDYRTRMEAAKLILAYAVGLPVVRQIRITGDFSTFGDKISKLAESPEGLRTLKQLKEMGVIDFDVKDSFKKGDKGDT